MTEIATDLSLEQKASLGSGASFWATKSVADVAAFTLLDGPHGVRAQSTGGDHLGIGASEPATCFPPAVGLAQSWDPELVERIGIALGVEARGHGVDVLLGPGINIKRDPRGGRNFEYFSEDPFLTAQLGSAWVQGIQSQGVGASLKHFAANNAEHDRMRSSSDIDPRTLREIYLRAFERVIRDTAPWTVMCSYNRINGVYASENRWLLTDVLRGEWGYEGVVVSDWGAVSDRVASVAAGLDLQMPGGGADTDADVVSAVRRGALPEVAVDAAASHVAEVAGRVERGRALPVARTDHDAHHELAREAAARSIVLLRNEASVLPLAASGSIAVIGRFAAEPRVQGGGSSHVNAARLDIPIDEIRALAPDATVRYEAGFTTDGTGDDDLRAKAVEAAAEAGVAVVFLGLDSRQESEGFDRETIELPANQLELLQAVAEEQPVVVVVLVHGGVLRLAPVIASADAILDAALLGQGGGHALARALFGDVNPSGRLAETVPVRLQDAPSYLNFPGDNSHVLYGEGVFVGYRGYDAKDIEVEYPFGHGLSYTTFSYSNLDVRAVEAGLQATLTITNDGSRDGREIVQVYVAATASVVPRPVRELAGFASVEIEAGGSAEVVITIPREQLAYWNIAVDAWYVEGGDYTVSVGASSRDIRLEAIVPVVGDTARAAFTRHSTLGELMAVPAVAAALAQIGGGLGDASASTAGDQLGTDVGAMMASMPIDRMLAFSRGPFDETKLAGLLALANSVE